MNPCSHPAEVSPAHSNFQQPLPILLQSFKPYAPDLNEDYFFVSLRADQH